ncbi:SDR family NAD(P)-dependent oxidoreductase [Nonlabens ulvanivorans]|uniref:SDR family NAD(P)-dependent oxidoreductase n=3 Tax=Nonlabens ulvanivorans TaxID=906888 RepID=UPI003262CD18
MSKLKGKVAVVTGGARDIGRSISLQLAAEGANVVINYNSSASKAEETKKMIDDAGGSCTIVQADLTKMAGVQKLKEATVAAYGNEVHVLVNNTGGIVARKNTGEVDEEFFDLLIDLNYKSTFFVTQSIVPLMNKGASIINLSSLAARNGGGGGAALYAASKGAITTLTRGWAKEFGPQGIRVNAVAPGMIATKFHDDFTPDEIRTNVAGMTPLRREGSADDVADLVVYLATDKSAYITGTNIDINGGLAFS